MRAKEGGWDLSGDCSSDNEFPGLELAIAESKKTASAPAPVEKQESEEEILNRVLAESEQTASAPSPVG